MTRKNKHMLLLGILLLSAALIFGACDDERNECKLYHDYINTVVDPTCIAAGYTIHTCSKCGYEYKDNYTEPLDSLHRFETETCSQCGKTIGEVAVTSYDMSQNYDGSITGYLVPINNRYYDLYIFGSGNIRDYSSYDPFLSKPLFDVEGIKNIYLSPSIERIGNETFAHCASLISIIIPDSVTSMGNRVFESCRSLKSIEIPDGVTSIGDSMFASCYSLKDIKIPDSVTSIGDGAFNNCPLLKNVKIPDGVTSIGDSAFYGRDNSYTIVKHHL